MLVLNSWDCLVTESLKYDYSKVPLLGQLNIKTTEKQTSSVFA